MEVGNQVLFTKDGSWVYGKMVHVSIKGLSEETLRYRYVCIYPHAHILS